MLFGGFVAALAGYATPKTIIIGSALILFSMIIQFWSKGCLRQQQEVTRTGPYCYVRHPFYLGNIVLDAGIVIMSGFLPLIVAAPIWWFVVYIPVMRREEKNLINLFGDEYRHYKARVPMIIPYRKALASKSGGFDWFCNNIVKTEFPRAIRYLIYPLAFLAAWRLSSQGLDVFSSPELTDLLIIVSIVSLSASRAIWLHHFKNGNSSDAPRPLLPAQLLHLDVRIVCIMTIIVFGVLIEALTVVRTDWIHWLPGLLFLGLSVFALYRFRHIPLLSEGALAIGMTMLFEFEWLGILLIPAYLALLLDHRARALELRGETAIQSFSLPCYLMIAVLGLVSAIAAELWIPLTSVMIHF